MAINGLPCVLNREISLGFFGSDTSIPNTEIPDPAPTIEIIQITKEKNFQIEHQVNLGIPKDLRGDFEIIDNYFLLHNSNGLQIIDLTNKENPIKAGSLEVLSMNNEIIKSGEKYITILKMDFDESLDTVDFYLQIYNFSDPEYPTLASNLK
ncbi:unnamed protein product, partial [marine sediment metagenome]